MIAHRASIACAAAVAVALLAGSPGHAQPKPGGAPQALAIVGGTVRVAPGHTLEHATVLIRGDRIVAVGADVAVPAGARTLDATGMVVTAGLIDGSTDLGLDEVAMERNTVEGQFAPLPAIHAAYRVSDGFNPDSIEIPVARTGGLTTAIAAPRGGLVSGTSAWLALSATPAIATTPAAMYVTLGEGSLASAEGSRGIAVEKLRELLDDAATYQRNRRAFERRQSRDFAAARLDLEALLPVLAGKLPLVVRAHRASDIAAAIRLGRDLGLRIVIEGGTEAWRVADDLAAARIPVILDPTANLPASFDQVLCRDDAAALLHAAGVAVAISGLGSGTSARDLRQLAGIAVARGLPPDAALAAITTVPAEIFAIPDRGRLAAGRIADLVVWSGDPFELSSQASHVIVAGVDQSLASHQSMLLERYQTLPPTR